jgi:hypothetical protein
MTILKAEILAHLNKELYRTESEVDEYILEALKDLSLRDDFLWVQAIVPTIIGRGYYSEPPDFKHELTIKIDDNSPLYKISWAEYQILIRNETSAARDLPKRYAQHGGFWYAYPTPDAVYIATLFYNAEVLESESEVDAVNNIKFKDRYRRALNTLTKAYYCRSKEMKTASAEYLMEFKMDILPELSKLVKKAPVFSSYNDL